MKKYFTVSLAVLAFANVQSLFGCDLCSVYSASEAQGGMGKGWYSGLAEQFTYFNTLQFAGHNVGNDGEYINSLNSQLFAGYNFNQRFSLQLNAPIIYRQYHRLFNSIDDGHLYMPATRQGVGVGGFSLLGYVRLYQSL